VNVWVKVRVDVDEEVNVALEVGVNVGPNNLPGEQLVIMYPRIMRSKKECNRLFIFIYWLLRAIPVATKAGYISTYSPNGWRLSRLAASAT
jgi:hypothetical protein